MKTLFALATLLHLTIAQHYLGQRFTSRFKGPAADNIVAAGPAPDYPEHTIQIPVDHFHNESRYEPHSDAKFSNRYWIDDAHYKPGGPVFLLIVGEAEGERRLAIMQKGIIFDLSKAHGGMSVVIEHRYFGKSQPTADLTTPNMRFLTTDQALADAVYFANNIVFPGHEKDKLTAKDAKWIVYGGSYAGAFASFLRTLYPGMFFGAISSSGVTEAITDFWAYNEPIRKYAPQDCISTTQQLTSVVDGIITGPKAKNRGLTTTLKDFFGLKNLTHTDDFASVVGSHISAWQGRNWDPAINDPTFAEYCGNVTKRAYVAPPTKKQKATAMLILLASGHLRDLRTLLTPLLNYAAYVQATYSTPCTSSGSTLDDCFDTHDPRFYTGTALSDAPQRSWPYMYCTQWGFFPTGSGVPSGQLPLISRAITLPYLSIICNEAFGISAPPDTDAVNKRGGFGIAHPRLAQVGGEADPWREAGPLKEGLSSTDEQDRPRVVMMGAVHHWDENGVGAGEQGPGVPPGMVVEAQKGEIGFVGGWLGEDE